MEQEDVERTIVKIQSVVSLKNACSVWQWAWLVARKSGKSLQWSAVILTIEMLQVINAAGFEWKRFQIWEF